MKRQRVKFLSDDPGGLWKAGDTAIDCGPEVPGLPLISLRIEKRIGRYMDEYISLTEPYERGLIERID